MGLLDRPAYQNEMVSAGGANTSLGVWPLPFERCDSYFGALCDITIKEKDAVHCWKNVVKGKKMCACSGPHWPKFAMMSPVSLNVLPCYRPTLKCVCVYERECASISPW